MARWLRKSTAYHEAGHAVAAIAQRLGVESVSIIPDPSRGTIEWFSAGRVTLEPPLDYGGRGIIVMLAGIAAQKRHAPTSVRRFRGQGDLEMARSFAGLGGDVTDVDDAIRVLMEERWNWLVARTRELVDMQWKVIDSVANRLLETGELTGSEVRAIFRQCGGIYWDIPILV